MHILLNINIINNLRQKKSVKCLYSSCKNTLHFADLCTNFISYVILHFRWALSEWTMSARTETRTHATTEASVRIFSACRLLATLAVGRDLVGERQHHVARHEVAI